MNKNLFKPLVLITLLSMFLLVACIPEDPEESKGIFYEVQTGNTSMYLLGSVHVGKEDMYPLDEEVEKAFKQSQVLGLELDTKNIDEMEIAGQVLHFAKYHDGSLATDLLPEEEFQNAADIIGVQPQMLNQFKPWYITMTLSNIAAEEAGYSSKYGVEEYFIQQAEDKEIIGLETVVDQIATFELLSNESQELYFEETLNNIEGTKDQMDELITLWRQGDSAAFAQMRKETLEQAPTPSLELHQRALLDERDKKMAETLHHILKEDSGRTYFVVVGAMHLVGENSIVDHLNQKGYEVNSVY
ncbi:TraB/GumN family protein [Proteinivorax hydrogeniformans]|uniref:TraB/GumN family protein n=1 Tax=Proteinivorax hydrogeniformans TaxID=1826727 RepID=A0AAU8HR08_9FIRM